MENYSESMSRKPQTGSKTVKRKTVIKAGKDIECETEYS